MHNKVHNKHETDSDQKLSSQKDWRLTSIGLTKTAIFGSGATGGATLNKKPILLTWNSIIENNVEDSNVNCN